MIKLGNETRTRGHGYSRWASLTLVALMLCASLLAACGSDSKSTSTDKSSNGERPDVKIGFNIVTTGPLAAVGKANEEGFKLAAAEAGADGPAYTFSTKDNQVDTNKAVTIARAMLGDVTAMVAGVTSTQVLALLPLAERAKVPILAPGISTASLTTQGNAWILRPHLDDAVAARVLAQYVKDHESAKRIAVIYDQAPFGADANKAERAGLQRVGLAPVADESFQSGDTDYSAQIAHVKQANADAVLVWAFSDDAVRIVQQLRRAGFDGFIGGGGNNDNNVTFGKPLGKLANGTAFVAGYFQTATQASKKFAADFQAKYGHMPDAIAADSYVAGRLVTDAVKAVGTDPAKVNDKLHHAHIDGPTGRISFDPKTGNSIHSQVYVGKWKDGKKQLVATYDQGKIGQ